MDRKWIVDANDREAAQEAFLEAEVLLYRLGGAISAVAHRREVEDGVFEPFAIQIQWESFAPAERRPKAVPDPEAA